MERVWRGAGGEGMSADIQGYDVHMYVRDGVYR